MARYEYEFSGIPARFVEPSGMDPNYRGGYRGMRMSGRDGRAPYGSHRIAHPGDMEGWGGFGGIHEGRVPTAGWDWGEGHSHYGARRTQLIREFNANSPALRRQSPSDEDRRQRQLPERDWAVPRNYRPGYSNRGLSDSGFGESWARFPMRGGR